MSLIVEDPREVEFDVRTDEMLVNMGPQHPSTHGVLRLLLRTDGEIVHNCEAHIGYLHRCAEKCGENLTPAQWIPYTDRMDYLAAMNMNLGLALTTEKLMGIEVPEKGRHLRVAICELNRIASHLLGMGAYAADLGSLTPFVYGFRERELILDLLEEVCGARLTYSYITIGGATHDLPDLIRIPQNLANVTHQAPDTELYWTDAVRQFLNWMEERVKEYHTLLTTNAIFIQRTAGIGVLSAEDALSYGCTSAVLRGSGVDWDLRRDGERIYTKMYDGYNFRIPVAPFDNWFNASNGPSLNGATAVSAVPSDVGRGTTDGSQNRGVSEKNNSPRVPPEAVLGDCWSRFFCRMLEVTQSIGLIRQALDKYEASTGPFREPHKWNAKLPAGEVYLETEAPRGQMGFMLVSKEQPVPLRARAKSSSFCNLAVVEPLCSNVLIGDVPAIVGSLDVVMGEIDR